MMPPTLALIGFGRMMEALTEAATKRGLTKRALRVTAEARFRRAVATAVEAMLAHTAELRDAPG